MNLLNTKENRIPETLLTNNSNNNNLNQNPSTTMTTAVFCGPRCVYHRNAAIRRTIQKLRVKNKRALFHRIRTNPTVTDQSFFPHCGFIVGHFAVLQALNEGARTKRNALPSSLSSFSP